jgi:hypothetical protein
MAVDRPVMSAAGDARQRREIAHRGRLLQYVTIAWNSAECVVALAAGFVAGSIALVGFGFDSTQTFLIRLRGPRVSALPEPGTKRPGRGGSPRGRAGLVGGSSPRTLFISLLALVSTHC